MTATRSDAAPDQPPRPELVEHLTVMRAQLGDHQALRTLFERYNPRLLYYLRRIVSPPGEAEDVLQDVWLLVIKKIATLEQPEAFKAWLYRVAHNRAVSRSRRRRESPLDELVDEELAAPAREVPDGLFAGYDPADLHAGLERLSPAHREALTLRFLDQLSYEEIAEVVGTNVGTVRSRLHYAKRTLHAHLTTGPARTRERSTP